MGLRDSLATEQDESSANESPVRLRAFNKIILAQELDSLAPGQQGWITFEDHDRLFATVIWTSGPNLIDDAGLSALRIFAKMQDSTFRMIDSEKRIYITRNERADAAMSNSVVGWQVFLSVSVLAALVMFYILEITGH